MCTCKSVPPTFQGHVCPSPTTLTTIELSWHSYQKNHFAHFNLDQVLKIVKIIKPKKTVLTNMHSDLDYAKLKKILPKNIVPGFDGFTIDL